jgi:hypothetical protein
MPSGKAAPRPLCCEILERRSLRGYLPGLSSTEGIRGRANSIPGPAGTRLCANRKQPFDFADVPCAPKPSGHGREGLAALSGAVGGWASVEAKLATCPPFDRDDRPEPVRPATQLSGCFSGHG